MSKVRKVITSQDIAASVLSKATMPAPLMTTEELQSSVKGDKLNFILMDEKQDDKLETVHQLLEEEQFNEAVLSLEYDINSSDIVFVSNEADSKGTDSTELTEVNDNASSWGILAGFASAVTIFNDTDSTVASPLASEPETVGYGFFIESAQDVELSQFLGIASPGVIEDADLNLNGLIDFFFLDVNGAIAELLSLDDPNGGEFDLENFSPDEFIATLFHNGQESVATMVNFDGGGPSPVLFVFVDDNTFSYAEYNPTDYIQLVSNGVVFNYSLLEGEGGFFG